MNWMDVVKGISDAGSWVAGFWKRGRTPRHLSAERRDAGFRFENDGLEGWTAQQWLRAYSASAWVYACVSAITANASRVGFKIYREERPSGGGARDESRGKPSWVEVPESHPAWKVLYQPNPNMSFPELLEATVGYLELTGRAFWEVVGLTVPLEIYVLRPDRMKPIPSSQALIGGWEYTVNSAPDGGVKFKPDEIIAFRYFSPWSEAEGVGAVRPLLNSLLMDFYTVAYNRDYFKKGTNISGYFFTEKELGEPALRRLKAEIESSYSGIHGFYKPPILFGGLEYRSLSSTPKDMAFKELREDIRKDILAVFHVPPIMLGLETANYATAREQKATFWRETMVPKLNKIAEKINQKLMPPFEQLLGERLWFTFDYASIDAFTEDYGKKVDTALKLQNLGVPLEAINRRLELGL